MNTPTVLLMGADIGGTKSDIGFYAIESRQPVEVARYRFVNADYDGVGDVFHEALQRSGFQPQVCCCAVAGPVTGNQASLTNLPWDIDGEKLKSMFGFGEVFIINDMTALCRALPLLQEKDLVQLLPGVEQALDKLVMRAVLAPGTGLGEGLILEHGRSFHALGSEGGHCSFAPMNTLQQELLNWMLCQQKLVSFEDVSSGPAIGTLYDFLRQRGELAPSQTVENLFAGRKDRTPVIIESALAGEKCPLCGATLELFLDILGAEAGNLALKTLPKGGLFLGGGILPRLYEKVSFSGFINSFMAKSKMAKLMETFPVYLILRGDAPLLGAAGFGVDRILEKS